MLHNQWTQWTVGNHQPGFMAARVDPAWASVSFLVNIGRSNWALGLFRDQRSHTDHCNQKLGRLEGLARLSMTTPWDANVLTHSWGKIAVFFLGPFSCADSVQETTPSLCAFMYSYKFGNNAQPLSSSWIRVKIILRMAIRPIFLEHFPNSHHLNTKVFVNIVIWPIEFMRWLL